MSYYAGLTAFRRMNQQHQQAARARGAVPGDNLRRIASDSAFFSDSFSSLNQFGDDDSNNPIPYNTSFSNPPSPRANVHHPFSFSSSPDPPDDESLVKKSSSSSDESKAEAGLSLLNTLLTDDDPVARTMAPFSHQRGILFGRQVLKLASKVPTRVSARTIANLAYPIHCISREIGSDGEMVTRDRQNWPCIFAPVMEPASPPPFTGSELIVNPGSVQPYDCRSHAVLNPDETVVCFRPLTFCSVHKNAGYLRLEDVERSENYTRVNAIFPIAKVTHRFNCCVLEFPHAEKLIYFKKYKDLTNPDEDHQLRIKSTNPDLPKPASKYPKPAPEKMQNRDEAGPSSRAQTQKKLCVECGMCIDDQDWYLYRNLVFCSEDCRYFHTRDKVLLRNRNVVNNDGNPRGPGDNRENRGAPNNGGNPTDIAVAGGNAGNPRAPNGSRNGGGPNNNSGNARAHNARGIVMVEGGNARARAAAGDQNQNPNQQRGGPAWPASSSSSSSGKNDKGKDVLYVG